MPLTFLQHTSWVASQTYVYNIFFLRKSFMEIAFFWQKAASWSKIQERRANLKLDFTIRTTWTYQAYCPKWAVLFQFFLWKRFIEIAFFWQKAASWSKIPKRRPHLKFYYQVNINLPTHETISEACQWHQFDMAQIGQNWLLSPRAHSKIENFWKFLFGGASLVIWNEKMDWQWLSMTSEWYGQNWPKLAFIALGGLKNENFWKISVQGC